MKLICMALKAEADVLLHRYKAERIQIPGLGRGLYRFVLKSDEWQVFLTGIGLKNARRSLDAYFSDFRPDFVLNLGTAASLSPAWPLKAAYAIRRVIAADSGYYFDLSAETSDEVRLLSGTEPVASKAEAENIVERYGPVLADMEGFAVAERCRARHVDFRIVKYSSDLGHENAEQEMRANLSSASTGLADYFSEQYGR